MKLSIKLPVINRNTVTFSSSFFRITSSEMVNNAEPKKGNLARRIRKIPYPGRPFFFHGREKPVSQEYHSSNEKRVFYDKVKRKRQWIERMNSTRGTSWKKSSALII